MRERESVSNFFNPFTTQIEWIPFFSLCDWVSLAIYVCVCVWGSRTQEFCCGIFNKSLITRNARNSFHLNEESNWKEDYRIRDSGQKNRQFRPSLVLNTAIWYRILFFLRHHYVKIYIFTILCSHLYINMSFHLNGIRDARGWRDGSLKYAIEGLLNEGHNH